MKFRINIRVLKDDCPHGIQVISDIETVKDYETLGSEIQIAAFRAWQIANGIDPAGSSAKPSPEALNLSTYQVHSQESLKKIQELTLQSV